jgi:V/A-type H+-transporting ATPase subunit C
VATVSYVYAVARLRALENRFLDAAFFSRLIDSATLEEALKSLGETVYGQWISGSAPSAFDRIIDSELIACCEDLERFVPDRALLDIYRMPYDFNNVKVVLKSLFKVREGGERRYDLLSRLGATDPEKLIMAFEGEEYWLLPYGIGDLIPRCWTLWEQTKNTRDIELLLDGAMFAAMKKTAETLGMPEVVRWVECRIDTENIGNAVRLARMNADPAASLSFFHNGGTIRPADAARLLGEPLESWGKALAHTGLGAAFEGLQQDRSDTQSALCEISKALSARLIRVLEKAKYSASAPENVILYLLQKEEEARNLRIALVCVANGLNREFARRLLSYAR